MAAIPRTKNLANINNNNSTQGNSSANSATSATTSLPMSTNGTKPFFGSTMKHSRASTSPTSSSEYKRLFRCTSPTTANNERQSSGSSSASSSASTTPLLRAAPGAAGLVRCSPPAALSLFNASSSSPSSAFASASHALCSPSSITSTTPCFDTIEEEMIFPMCDIQEESEGSEEKTSNVKTFSSSDSQPTTTSSKTTSTSSVGQHRSKPTCVIPKIIKEDFDCSCEVAGAASQRNCCKEQLHPGGAPAPVSSSAPKSLRLRYSKINNKLRNLNSPTTITSASMADEQAAIGPYKQRIRSHSGPAYPIGFRATTGAVGIPVPGNRQQQQQQQHHDGSLKTPRLVSPNGSGGSFLDNFRPRSTSESKNKKPSVISVIKNSFRSSCNSSNNNTGGGGGTNAPLSAAYQSLNSSTGNNNYSTNLAGGETQVASVTTSAGFGGAQATQQQQPAPTSPGAVMDPFSLDYLYALNHSLDCPQHPNYHQQFHHHSHHNHHQHHHSFHGHKSARPRSRSGSSGLVASSVGGGGGGGGGMGPTMARMFDMFRGRSNSIAASTVASEGGCNCNSTITHQDSICDRISYEDVDENLIYVRFFKFYRCYDLIPISAKLVVFDTQLAVKKAFFALLQNGVRAAPLWDSTRHEFVGMLTITDFINILRTYYNSPDLKMEELEEHNVDNWRSMLKEKARKMVSIDPDESLFKAIKMLIHNKVHRLPVIDPETGNVLYVLTHKRLLKFMFLYYYTRLPMPSFLTKSLKELNIGTYDKIAVIKQSTPLIEALDIMIERRVSALPVVDDKNKVTDIYSKFDVIHLAADKMYQDLDITVQKALEFRNTCESVVKCTLTDTLHCILERIVQAEVHRIVVVDADDQVIGIASLSDLLTFLVLKPVGLERKEGVPPHIRAIAEVLEESAEEAHHHHHMLEKAGGGGVNKTETTTTTTHLQASITEEETGVQCSQMKTEDTLL